MQMYRFYFGVKMLHVTVVIIPNVLRKIKVKNKHKKKK